MKLIIDEEQCLKHHLTVEEVLAALAIRTTKSFQGTLDNLVNRNIITNVENDYMLTQRWSDEIDEILADSQERMNDDERIKNLANKMRECYPKGKMPNSPYYYRCNQREVELKLKKFFITYGNYTDDEIIDATKRYVASFQGNYRYLPLIKYFIMKNKPVLDEDGSNHAELNSPLAVYLENKEDETLVTASDDWLTTVRN